MNTSDKAPKISIVATAFNHAKFVERFIESALNQTEQDFELIIVDDYSIDDTVKKIQQFSDERIRLICHEYNQGVNSAVNDGLAVATGRYIVFMSADDMFYPQHLEKSVGYLEAHPDTDVFYCLLTAVDENDNLNTEFFKDFKPASDDKSQALRVLFFVGNTFLSPGMVVRKSLMDAFYPLPITICNTEDYELHIKLLIKGNYHQSDEYLIYYRRLENEANLSAENDTVKTRYNYEIEKLMDTFLMMSVQQINAVFAKEIERLKLTVSEDNIPFVLGRIAMTSREETRKFWGYHKIMDYLDACGSFDAVYQTNGFNFKSFLDLSKEKTPSWLEKVFYKRWWQLKKKRLRKQQELNK